MFRSASISTRTYFDSELQDHLRLISKLPRLEMLKIGPQSFLSILKPNIRFRTLKALMMDKFSFVAPPSFLRGKRHIFPKLATFYVESRNFVHCMTKKKKVIPLIVLRKRTYTILNNIAQNSLRTMD